MCCITLSAQTRARMHNCDNAGVPIPYSHEPTENPTFSINKHSLITRSHVTKHYPSIFRRTNWISVHCTTVKTNHPRHLSCISQAQLPDAGDDADLSYGSHTCSLWETRFLGVDLRFVNSLSMTRNKTPITS